MPTGSALLATKNFTDLPYYAISESGDTYTIKFAFLTSTDLSTVTDGSSGAYYSGFGQFAADFVQATAPVQSAYLTIMAPAGTVADTNYYSDVANITFSNQSSSTPPDTAITIGELNYALNPLADTVFQNIAYATGSGVNASLGTGGNSTDQIIVNGYAVNVGNINSSTLLSNLNAYGEGTTAEAAGLAFFASFNSSGALVITGTQNEALTIADGTGSNSGGLADVGLTAGTIATTKNSLTDYADTLQYISGTGNDSLWSALNGDIWLNNYHSSLWSGTISPGAQAFAILLHEMGHSLGLIHPADGTYSAGQSIYYTIMGADGAENPFPGMTTVGPSSSAVYVSGLQMDDMWAIQDIYGANFETRLSDDIYGMGHGFSSSSSTGFVSTIWDGGGQNVIDARSYTGAAIINLNQGEFSSLGPGDTGYVASSGHSAYAGPNGWENPNGYNFNGIAYQNLAIADGTVIQDAIGTQGADTLVGNLWNNVLAGAGTGGFNTIYSDQTVYDQTLTTSLGPGTDWVGYAKAQVAASNTTYNYAAWAGDPNYVAPPTLKNDVLIGYGDNNGFYVGKGNDVIDGGYNATDINNAANAISSGWGTSSSPYYWDPEGNITGSTNVAGALSNISDSSANTGNAVSYSYLGQEDSAVNSGGQGLLIQWSGQNDQGDNPIYEVEKGGLSGSSPADGTDRLINIQTILLSPGINIFSQTGEIEKNLLLEGDYLVAGPSKYILNMGPNESGLTTGTTGGTLYINDTTGKSTLDFQSTTGDQLKTMSIDHWVTGAAGFNGADDVTTIAASSNGSETQTVVVDLTTMAAGGGLQYLDIGGHVFGGQAFADWVLTDPTALGTSISADTLYSDVYGSSPTDPSTLNPTPVYDSSGNISGMVAPQSVGDGDFVDRSPRIWGGSSLGSYERRVGRRQLRHNPRHLHRCRHHA